MRRSRLNLRDRIAVSLAVAVAVVAIQAKGCVLPDLVPDLTPGPTAATVVYDKDQAPIPSAVKAAIDEINRTTDIVATFFEANTRDGSGQVPDQYRVPAAAAEGSGVPALVVTSGDTVLKVRPIVRETTKAEVMEAVQ